MVNDSGVEDVRGPGVQAALENTMSSEPGLLGFQPCC